MHIVNGFERSLAALRFEETDCVPTWGGYIVSAGFFEYVTGKDYWSAPRETAIEAYRKLEVDMLKQNIYLPNSPEEYRKHGHEVLEGAEKYRSPEDVVAFIEALPEPEEVRQSFDFSGHYETVLSDFRRSRDEYGDDIYCLPNSRDCRFVWYMEFGYEAYLSALALYPEKIRKLFAYAAEVIEAK